MPKQTRIGRSSQKFIERLFRNCSCDIGASDDGHLNAKACDPELHDSQVWDELLHGEETSAWADKGYVSAKREATLKVPGKAWGVMRKAPKGDERHRVDGGMA